MEDLRGVVVDRAALLWSLLHNGASPDGRWTEETRHYYERVIILFDEASS